MFVFRIVQYPIYVLIYSPVHVRNIPLTAFKEVFEQDIEIKKRCGLWVPEWSPNHDGFVTREMAINLESMIFWNPYSFEDLEKVGMWMAMATIPLIEKGASWNQPTIPGQPRAILEKHGTTYEWFKRIKITPRQY